MIGKPLIMGSGFCMEKRYVISDVYVFNFFMYFIKTFKTENLKLTLFGNKRFLYLKKISKL